MAQMTMIQAITNALDLELARDKNVYCVRRRRRPERRRVPRHRGACRRSTAKNRVFDTPLAESGICGPRRTAWRCKDSARWLKSNSSASCSKRWTKSPVRRRACATVPAAATPVRLSSVPRLAAA